MLIRPTKCLIVQTNKFFVRTNLNLSEQNLIRPKQIVICPYKQLICLRIFFFWSGPSMPLLNGNLKKKQIILWYFFFNVAAFQKTNDYLKKHVFISSKFYEHAIGVLDIYRCITIVGPPGCGKTLTALQLASRKCGRGGRSQLYFCETLEEILTTAQMDSDAYIIMDDWLDK